MDQQEIDKLIEKFHEITTKFRNSLNLAVDSESWKYIENKSVLLNEANALQINTYIDNIAEFISKIPGYTLYCMRNENPEVVKLNLSALYVKDDLDFHKNKFTNIDIDFSYSIFNSYFSCNCEINLKANFENTIFNENSNFNNTTFSDVCKFSNAVFKKGAFFIQTKFKTSFHFENVIFNDVAKFNNADFSWARFENAVFNGNTEFVSVKFNSYAYFQNTKFNKRVSFYKSEIVSSIRFNGAEFAYITDFNMCTFKGVLVFHNTKLYPDTSFEKAMFLSCQTEEDYRAYRTLKQHMSNVHAKLEENMFFALEQKTRRHLDAQDMRKNWFTVTVSYLYDLISGYGQNIVRPLGLLFSIWLVFGLIFSFPHFVVIAPPDDKTINIVLNASASANPSTVPLPNKISPSVWFTGLSKDGVEWTNPGTGLMYSFQNIFNPASLFGKDNLFTAGNIVILILAYIEFLMAIAFITLWLLAVRRRFQKGE